MPSSHLILCHPLLLLPPIPHSIRVFSNESTLRMRYLWLKMFPGTLVAGKESACNEGDPSSIPGSGSSPGEEIGYPLQYSWASLVTQMVHNPPGMWEIWVWSLGWEDPLEKGITTYSRILAWRIPWTEEPGRLQSMMLQKSRIQLSN